MKPLVTLFFALYVSLFVAQAQVKIGDNLANINANSLLELESTTKALLLPRLSQTQIDAMQNVPAGMLVYNNTTNSLYIRTNTGWTSLLSTANSAPVAAGWTNSGSTIYTTDPASKVGIGKSAPTSALDVNGTIVTSGQMGIGTNTPSEALEVNGNIKYSGNLQMGIQYVYSDVTFPAGTNAVYTINCPTGTKLIGGGGGLSGNNSLANYFTIAYSGPQKDNNNNWLMVSTNTSTSNLPVRIYAICAKVQ